MSITLALTLLARPPAPVIEPFTRSDMTIDVDGKPFTLPYRLRQPSRAGSSGADTRYPLLVFLHGAGERGSENERQLIHLPKHLRGDTPDTYDGFVLAPQCPKDHKWVEVPWGDQQSTPMPADPSAPMQALLHLLDELLTTQPIDRDAISITGLSMGGYGTWDLLARRPNLFAAAMPLCGGGDEHTVARFAQVPIWVWHGARDRAVPVERSRTMVAALRQAGADTRYSELPQVEHRVWDVTYADPLAMGWLLAQRRRTVAPKPHPRALRLTCAVTWREPADRTSAERLAQVLRERTGLPLPIAEPTDTSPPRPGDVVVALPDNALPQWRAGALWVSTSATAATELAAALQLSPAGELLWPKATAR